LGQRLRRARQHRKKNQTQLAQAAGITQSSISDLETGATKEISGPTLIAISHALKVRPEWLVTGKLPIEYGEAEALSDDERELLANYRAAQPRWRVNIMNAAKLDDDGLQNEAAERLITAQAIGRYRVTRPEKKR
jgi:transcriptional regulator with XRE-family HTH domain